MHKKTAALSRDDCAAYTLCTRSPSSLCVLFSVCCRVCSLSAVHDLHIWSLSVGKPSLSVHLYCTDDAKHVLAAANKMCAAKYNIHHSTIQVERQHDDIECNDAFIPPFTPGHASLDRIATENFASLGITQV